MRYYTTASSKERRFFEIWQYYKLAKEADQVIRYGFGAYGLYDYREAQSDIHSGRRGESDAEHQYGVAILLDGVISWFPELLPEPIRKDGWLQRMALTHDVCEVSIGDIPDDGSRDEEWKQNMEVQAMQELAYHMPVDMAHMFMANFQRFNSNDSGMSAAMRLVRLGDKIEAPLELIRREMHGFIGRATVKEDCYGGLTQRDRDYIAITHSENPTDIWSYGTFARLHVFPEFPVFLGIMSAALLETRGEVFPWYKQETSDILDIAKLQRIVQGSAED